MLTISALALLAAGLAGLLILCRAVLFPPRHPANIPAVPFYYALLPLLFSAERAEPYRARAEELLRRHGAAKVYFGSRWNVVLSRPEFVARILRDETLFRKSGNFEKLPHSILSALLGENVISASGDRWRLFRRIVTGALDRGWDRAVLRRNTATLVAILSRMGADAGRTGVAVQEILQRFTMANTAECLFGMDDAKPLEQEESKIHKLHLMIKRRIFLTLFLNFPILDRLPIPSRIRDRRLVDEFSATLQSLLDSRRQPSAEAGSPTLGDALAEARASGRLTQKELRDNLNVLFIASQENPQTGLMSALYLLARHQPMQQRLYEELCGQARGEDGPDGDTPYLTAVIYEALRLFPPINQLINRVTTGPALLSSADSPGPIVIPAGTYVGYHAYIANRDPAIWGTDSAEFRPERWGRTRTEITATRRRAGAAAGFITFHGGRRSCVGEKFALSELEVAVGGVVSQLRLELVEGDLIKMTSAGPLYPRDLRLVVSKRATDMHMD